MNRDSQEHPATGGRRRGSSAAEWALRAVLAGMGTVAAATGSAVAIRGSRAIPGGTAPGPSTDSVLRFYAVWWAAQGPVMWRLARQPRPPWGSLASVLVPTFLGGLARLAARRRSGPPHPLFRALTAAELVLPPLMLELRRLTRHPGDGRSPRRQDD